VLLLAIAFCVPARAATLFDPVLRFRVLETPHFRIYFHQGEDRLASHLAAIAEDTWTALQRPLGVMPPRLTHVVLADQSEVANGYATPLPYDTIVLYASWAPGDEFYTDDWLRLTFTHEFTHILHLDRSESWARVVRHVFGRTLLAFPNLLLPTWQIEGIAVYEESTVTGEGRLHSGDFRAIVDEAARRRQLEPIDRVNGGLTDWPGGEGPYAYGSEFHQYLADRFGAATLAALADATASRVPYTGSRAFKRVFGESLGGLWRDYEAALVARAGSPAPDAGISRVTHQGFLVSGPRFDRFACDRCPPEIVYASQTPHEFPRLYRARLDGSPPQSLAWRYLGSTTAIGRESMYFDQLEVRRNVSLYGDLFELSRATGHVRQLTSEARLLDPDLSPDGNTIVCVQQQRGHRDLVLVRGVRSVQGSRTLAIETLAGAPDTQFNAPRWSPDGRLIAVERHRLGAQPELVVVDLASRTIRVIASDRPGSASGGPLGGTRARAGSARIVTPAWRPDGSAIVAAVANEEDPFNLYEFAADGSSARQLTHMTGGALWPDVSPDGKTLVFAGYTTNGYDVFSMAFPPPPAETQPNLFSVSRIAQETTAPGRGTGLVRDQRAIASELWRPQAYSPWPTLRPTSWFPIVVWDSTEVRAGASTGGRDVLGYHAYTASATWLLSGPANALTPSSSIPDWSASYAYERWRPAPFLAASSATSFFAGPPTAAGTPTAATRKERQLEIGVLVPFLHTRISHSGFASFAHAVDDYTLPEGLLSRDRSGIHLAWETASAHLYGYSISPEDGIVAGTTVELVRTAFGASADATTATADVRAYVSGFGGRHHVIAARVAGGVSTGNPTVGRAFLLGGATSNPSVVDFGSSAISLLRGFPSNSFAGTHVALINVEYRWPLVRPERGIGTWPFFLHTLHAAVVGDAGHTWTAAFDASAIKTSYGAELSANLVAGFVFPFTATAGVARGHDGSGGLAGTVAYFRIGRSF
jgi:hypothetical protein